MPGRRQRRLASQTAYSSRSSSSLMAAFAREVRVHPSQDGVLGFKLARLLQVRQRHHAVLPSPLEEHGLAEPCPRVTGPPSAPLSTSFRVPRWNAGHPCSTCLYAALNDVLGCIRIVRHASCADARLARLWRSQAPRRARGAARYSSWRAKWTEVRGRSQRSGLSLSSTPCDDIFLQSEITNISSTAGR